jgi:hypothetical protein
LQVPLRLIFIFIFIFFSDSLNKKMQDTLNNAEPVRFARSFELIINDRLCSRATAIQWPLFEDDPYTP